MCASVAFTWSGNLEDEPQIKVKYLTFSIFFFVNLCVSCLLHSVEGERKKH